MVDQRRAEVIDNRLTEAGFTVPTLHLHYDEGGNGPATLSAKLTAPLETWEGWVSIAKVEELAQKLRDEFTGTADETMPTDPTKAYLMGVRDMCDCFVIQLRWGGASKG